MRILIVSPIASHPQRQGNATRIATLGDLLRSLGHTVDYLYYAMEGLTGVEEAAMRAAWDSFMHVMPTIDTTKRGAGDFYLVDDWFEQSLSDAAYNMHCRHRYDVVWVNYIWLTKVFSVFPTHVRRVLDTHDVFSNRNQVFADLALRPSWFFTTPEQERLALCRADAIVAIQDHEAAYFRKLLRNDAGISLFTIGHISCPRFLAPRIRSNKKIRVGYIGSANPLNVRSIEDLQSRLRHLTQVTMDYQFLLAGPICDAIDDAEAFVKLGIVDTPEDFYRDVDVIINPMPSGTGLKIKTIEALSFGRPVAGTRAAFSGISTAQLDAVAPPTPFRQLLTERSIFLTAEQARKVFLRYTRFQFSELMECLRWASAPSPLSPDPKFVARVTA